MYCTNKIIYDPNGKLEQSMTKKHYETIRRVQRRIRINHNLKKYFNSRKFNEWWYSPSVKGGMLSKADMMDFATGL